MTINDESYLTLSHTTLSENNRFYSSNVCKTPNLIKNKYVTKFEPKILVYLAISSRGMSRPIFFPHWTSRQSECLQGKMLEAVIDSFYYREKYRHRRYVFWTDLTHKFTLCKQRPELFAKREGQNCTKNGQSGKCSKSPPY